MHAEMQKVYDHYINMMPGAPAIDFEMTDVNGKKYRLSDFKGKAVYIDVWATLVRTMLHGDSLYGEIGKTLCQE